MLPMLMIRAVGAEVRNRPLNRGEDRTDIDRDQPVELLQRKRLDVAEVGHSGVVDEDVQAAELGHRVVDRLRDLLGVGAVGLNRYRGAAVTGNLGDQLLGLGGGAAVGEGDGRAVGGQSPHDLCPDAAGSSGNQRTPSLQVCHAVVNASFRANHSPVGLGSPLDDRNTA